MNLSNQPPKGTSDWFPAEFAVRKYIFDTWRKVCEQFGYEEYLTPIVESAEVYRAKSGEDVGGKELMTMTDLAGRELAIRPEMTPSVTRMVTRQYESMSKPIRLFSIANFLRNEKPQKGRNREFWQLNFDLFGSESIYADLEILHMAAEIMSAFGATAENYVIYFGDRQLIEQYVERLLNINDKNKVATAIKIIDKFQKISNQELIERLTNEAGANITNPDLLINFLKLDDAAMEEVRVNVLEKLPAWERFRTLAEALKVIPNAENLFVFNPSMVRGFDYYDGMVFEVFDRRHYYQVRGEEIKEEFVSRSLFGGGRYNGLAGIFGKQSFPAVGCAPGDETTKLFLESWNLIPKNLNKAESVYIPLLVEQGFQTAQKIALELRRKGLNVEVGVEPQKLGKALDYANKKQFNRVAILGENEINSGVYRVKDMNTRTEEETKLPA